MSRFKYSSLRALVQACKTNEQRGLACMLTEECIMPRSANAVASGGGKWEVQRSELTPEHGSWDKSELGKGNFGIVYLGMYYILLNQCPIFLKHIST